MVRRRAGMVAGALIIAIGLAAGCGGDDEGGGLSSGDAGGDSGDADVPDDVVVMDGSAVRVSSIDNIFRAENIQVAPGTTVTWTNDGRNEHDVLPVEGDGWGVEVGQFQPGESYQHTFAEPGVYPYYCSIHGTTTAGMIGTVVVAE